MSKTDFDQIKNSWNIFGKQDPLWSILTDPAKKGNKWELEEFFRTGKEEIDELMEYINLVDSRERALDFGCGVGRLTQPLCSHFNECYGVDIAESMIELAKQYNRHGNKCEYILNESDNLEIFPDNYFDFILSKIVLQHINPKYSKNYLQEFLRILRPGGILLFQLPSEPNPSKTLINSAYRAQINLQELLIIAKAGSITYLQVRVKNNSNTTWPSFEDSNSEHRIYLGNHWLDHTGLQIMENDDGREGLPQSIPPGDRVDLSLQISMPRDSGNYILELDMVHEDITWFKDKGSQTVKIPVQVYGTCNVEMLKPEMEMHGIPKDVVLELIEKQGGNILSVREDLSACRPTGWTSYLYCVTISNI